MDQDETLRPPRPPRLGFDGEEEDYEDSLLENPFTLGEDMEARSPPVDKEKREEMMLKARERLERMRTMSPEERIVEMRRERDERVAERATHGDGAQDKRAEDLDELLGPRKSVWRSKSGDYGPPKPRTLGLENLSPEERHAKLLEHQKLMEDHRGKMDEWREKHEAYMSERRAIMDAYRDLSHQIREAVFASRPLR